MATSAYIHAFSDETSLADFLEQTSSPLLLVDVWAPWCPPCLTLGRVLEEVIPTLGGAVRVAKIEFENAPQLVQKHSIMSIPTLLGYREGKLVAQHTGSLSAEALRSWVAQYTHPKPAQ